MPAKLTKIERIDDAIRKGNCPPPFHGSGVEREVVIEIVIKETKNANTPRYTEAPR